STTTPAGLLVTLSGRESATEVVDVLRAAGYTADEEHTGTVMVGGVDRIALLDAQIAALTAQRARLAQDREVLDRMEDVMGGPFCALSQIDLADTTRGGVRARVEEAAALIHQHIENTVTGHHSEQE